MRVRQPQPASSRTAVAVALGLRDVRQQLLDDVAQAMRLQLAGDVGGDAARILDVLLAVHHLPHRLGLRADGVPHVHGEDQRVAARVVVEDHLGRRVGEDAAVPVELAVDAHCREGRRQGARRHDVLDAERHVAAVEVLHLARAHVRGADRQAGPAAVDEREVDELGERLFQRLGRVVAGAVGAQHDMRCPRRPSDWARRSRGCRARWCSSRTASATAAARRKSRARSTCAPCDPRTP